MEAATRLKISANKKRKADKNAAELGKEIFVEFRNYKSHKNLLDKSGKKRVNNFYQATVEDTLKLITR